MKCDSDCTLIVKNSGSFNDGDKVDTIYEIEGGKYNISKNLTKNELASYLSDINFICEMKNGVVISKIPQIIPSVYDRYDTKGDFLWMIKNDAYYTNQQPLFIFNDNIYDHKKNVPGGGNGQLRPYKYDYTEIPEIKDHIKDQFNVPKIDNKYFTAWGIPTDNGGNLTDELKRNIDDAIREIKLLIKHYNITTIYYSAERDTKKEPYIDIENNGKTFTVPNLGSGIFDVQSDVKKYIVTEIYKLKNDIINNYAQKNLN